MIDLDAATVLLALGADPTYADGDGGTPCMAAAEGWNNGCPNSVACLRALAAGGPGGALVGDAVNAVDDFFGRTALDHALANSHA